jgi:catechol 2,3-dioxygenase-like lactoylglutathione lyase family enzyme
MGIRWTHITISVSDLDRAVEFYGRWCKLSVLRDRRGEGGSTVWLGYAPPSGEWPQFVLVLMRGEVTDRLDHFGFQCDTRAEVEHIAAQAESLGILAEPPTDLGGVVGYFTVIRDPDGHLIEFTHGQPLRGLA